MRISSPDTLTLYMLLIDNTVRKVPIARIYVDTPYLKGQVEAQCLSTT